MQSFQILDENRYPIIPISINKDNSPYHRFEHIVTLGKGFREFIVYIDHRTEKVHLEEITGGNTKEIEEDSLFNDINDFLLEKDLLKFRPPIIKDNYIV
jgi:hypothetical protein